MLIKPRPCPVLRPFGPPRAPSPVCPGVAAAVASLSTAAEAGAVWTRLTAAAEGQLCALHDLIAEPAGPVPGAAACRGLTRREVDCFVGRGRGFKVKARQHAHHVHREYGNISEGEEGMMGVIDLLTQFAVLLRKHARPPLAEVALRRKLTRPEGKVKEYIAERKDFDKELTILLELGEPRSAAAAAASKLAATPRAEIAARARERAKAKNGTYADFVKAQLAGGAGAFHSILRDTVFDEAKPVVLPDGELSLKVMDILADENEQWEKGLAAAR